MASSNNPSHGKGDRGYIKTRSSDKSIGAISNYEKSVLGLLDSMSVTYFEPKVVNVLIEYMRRYTTEILSDAQDYAHHAGRKKIEVSDAKLAIQLKQMSGSYTLPSQQEMHDISSEINMKPLPMIPEAYGVRLPQSGALLTPNYQISTAAQSKDESQPKKTTKEQRSTNLKKQGEEPKIRFQLGGEVSETIRQDEIDREATNKRKLDQIT